MLRNLDGEPDPAREDRDERTQRPRSCGASRSGSITKARRLGTVAYTRATELSPPTVRVASRRRAAIAAYIAALRGPVETGGERGGSTSSRRCCSTWRSATRVALVGTRASSKFGPRRGDNAPISLIELVGDASEPKAKGGAKATGAYFEGGHRRRAEGSRQGRVARGLRAGVTPPLAHARARASTKFAAGPAIG